MILKQKKINKIILFGGSIILLDVAKRLKKENFIIEVYSSNRLLNEIINSNGSLKNNLILEKIKFYSTNNINKCKEIDKSITSNSLGIGFGETWSFEKKIINQFNGYLLDYMGIPLPRYRGGAHFTWMIMQNEKNNGACLQLINEDMIQGIFDSGEILVEIKFKNYSNWNINDYFKKQTTIAIKLIFKFLKTINKKDIKGKKINENYSFYLPRLNTKINGWINWYSWNTLEILRFIKAFGDPYDGASSMINKKRIFIKNANLVKKSSFHPFQNGLICNINNKTYDVITKNGIINLEIIFEKKPTKLIKVGDRIYTPIKKLETAFQSKPNYDSFGLTKK
tara:strand:- start:135 stop:1148 length:1014 start_codon:yes stop_codon:yes gene_type:complete